ncbi:MULTISPECIES: hypothetical protein [Leptospira]|uniref:Uncharacterized protein n=1 Tax=Leptospira interrogans TaxID=173 RepID=A0AAV9FU55_LEPIR|nr:MULTISPECIES: hypothetical protein [Leptospira]EKO89296.1 hypothetical protein LEP1GSC009_4126 [Leptospira interrogans serovar Grippotyphosa str. Andaman]EKP83659.1 hypothetical protein LEP1GSC020_3164 [Leptospira interrogans serovar Grippotyphosa str. 2006006986]EMN56200.1 hypothetical protein LEP1GSC089_2791 [Leptospira interrogans serovar Autumnalis str. LP101]EMN79803.1 hypothetical protein LEP1GSC106_3444 [Leptospira interrogans serovar Grippotyphosa str. UI 12764]EMO01997.1 hypothetic
MPVKKKTANKKAVRKTAKKKTGKVPTTPMVPSSSKGLAVNMNPEKSDKEVGSGKENTERES